jgi:hypothetical protein
MMPSMQLLRPLAVASVQQMLLAAVSGMWVTADSAFKLNYPCIGADDGVPLAVLLLQDYTSLVMNATGWDGWVAADLPAAK